MGAVRESVLGIFSSASLLINSVRRPDCRNTDADPFGAFAGVAGDADLGVLVIGDTEPSCCSNVLPSTAIGVVYSTQVGRVAPSAPPDAAQV